MKLEMYTYLDEKSFNQTFKSPATSLDLFKLDNLSSIKCVVPVVCQMDSCVDCWDTLIINCVYCSKQAVFFLLCFYIVLSLAVLIANLLIIFVGVKRVHQGGKSSKMNSCKISLAVADLIGGKKNNNNKALLLHVFVANII